METFQDDFGAPCDFDAPCDFENDFDVETIANYKIPKRPTTQTLRILCDRLVKFKERTERAKEIYEKNKEALRLLQEEHLPAVMAELGLNATKLQNGAELSLAKNYFAKIPAGAEKDALAWLEAHGSAAIAKQTLNVTHDHFEQAKKACEKAGVPYDVALKIHPQTLKAFVREQLEKGENLPFETFGVYVQNIARVKLPK